MTYDLRLNKVAVISGATKGIGRATALAFAKEGFDLAMGARTIENLEAFKKEIFNLYPNVNVLVHPVDFSLKADIDLFVQKIKSVWKRVDVIVNNVGTYNTGFVSTDEDGVLEKLLNLNLFSAYHLTRPFLAEMKNAGSGYVFTICSVLSKMPRAEAASYTISKYALYGFSQVLAEEMRDYNVKVSSVIPGSVQTASWEGVDVPDKTLVQPGDVANAIIVAYKMSPGAYVEEIVVKPLNRTF